ncbi:DUF5011 domain-containing protein [Clostridium sp. NSJ-145]|uniref:immunoglobulin-like domain-containing protein n=1 Tax=Clostridium sp. NSJ-145 TaxID=2897777 RepID=UPI001E291FBA|nr:immunoglobulin-like domain-containing protein [Clostridium sp. NSJ-145]MCD2502336.1 DUF5011 domain-containing protein [Clostridium sp. NSJ-145]
MELEGNPKLTASDDAGNPIDTTKLFEITYGSSNLGLNSFNDIYTDDKDVIKVRAKEDIESGTIGEIKFTFKAASNVSQVEIGSLNVFNAYYRRKYDGGSIVMVEGNYVGLRLAIGQVKGIAFLDKDNDGLYKQGIDEPLSGVEVELYNKNTNKSIYTTTNNLGEYKFEGLDNGEYEVRINNEAGGYDINKTGARRFTKQTALSGESYKNDSDVVSTNNIDGVISVSIPTTSYFYDVNDYMNIGFVEPVTVEVKDDGNGTVSGKNSGIYKAWPFTNIEEPEKVVANTGYTFVNYTNEDTGKVFTFPSQIDSNITIKANFEKKLFKVTLNANGGNPGSTVEKTILFDGLIKESLDLLTDDEKPTRDGYSFVGWAKKQDGTEKITDTDRMEAADLTLYAVWDEAPVINIAGDLIIKEGSTVNLLDGVNVTDKEDITITNIVTGGETVDKDRPGQYRVTYTVTDSAGNVVTKERIVKVYGAPIIEGTDEVIIKEGGTFDKSQGVTARDTFGVDLTSSINVTDADKVNVNSAGKYIVKYTVRDVAGNEITVDRVVKVYGLPTINATDEVILKAGETFEELKGVTARDSFNVDLQIDVKDADKVDVQNAGKYPVKYTVRDAAGNEVTKERIVKVYEAPTINATDEVILKIGETFEPLKEVTAEDSFNVSLPIDVKDADKVDIQNSGKYPVIYTVKDDAGNVVTKERIVKVYGNPTIDATDEVILKVGENFEPLKEVTAKDSFDVSLQIDVEDADKVDIQNPGKYTVRYIAKDAAGNVVIKERTVKVYEAPTIKATDEVILKVGETFEPLKEVTAEDSFGTSLQIDVKNADQVNVQKPGQYPVIYTVRDDAGNEATKERIVKVYGDPTIDATDEVILKVGENFEALKEVTAKDSFNVNLQINVQDADKVDVQNPGQYPVRYTVRDAAGNEVTKERIVKVYGDPTIDATDEVILKVGETFEELKGVTAKDSFNVSLPIDVEDADKVDVQNSGKYTVRYIARDDAGNVVTKERIVKVYGNPTIDATDEVILKVGETFEPLKEVTAKDSFNVNLQINVQDADKVDVQNPGKYPVIYTVRDDAGNVVTKERVVKVYGTPVIDGTDEVILKVGGTFDESKGVTAEDSLGEDLTSSIKVTDADKVDVSNPGQYTVTYTVRDAAGNEATENRVVKVYGTPVIDGTDEVILKVGETFEPLKEVIAKDSFGTSLQINVKNADKVNVQKPGQYPVIYTARDAAGNEVTKERIVKVYGDPIIDATDEVILKVGETFEPLKEVTAKDSFNVSLSIDVKDADKVDVQNVGQYPVRYTVRDAAGNEVTKERIVKVYGTPVIDGTNEAIIKAGATFDELKGVTAKDSFGVSLTQGITVEGLDKLNLQKAGKYTIKYIVEDAAGNKAIEYRVIKVYGTPVIDGANTLTLKIGETFNKLDGVTAKDSFGVDLTSSIKVSGADDVDINNPGQYKVTYTVKDAAGNEVTVERTVIVVTNGVPEINGADNVAIKVGDNFEPLDNVTATDKEDGPITNIVVGGDKVDVNKPGQYRVTYTVRDNDGNEVTVERIVKVYGLPVIDGIDEEILKVGGTFDELDGVNAEDSFGVSLLQSITVEGLDKLDLQKSGKYTIKYIVEDAAGNKVIEERVIKVYGTPVIDATDELILKVGEKFDALKEVTAKDSFDTNLQINVEDADKVNVQKPGQYPVRYTVRDAAGNEATKERIVKVYGTPVIDGTDEVILKVGGTFDELDGVNAEDSFGVSLLQGITVEGLDKLDLQKSGKYTIKYIAEDAAGNKVIEERVIKVYGTPVIDATDEVILKVGETFEALKEATAKDSFGTELQINVESADKVDIQNQGEYPVKYTVTDAAGNVAEKVRIVKVYGTPTITASDEVILKVGSDFDKLYGVSAEDSLGISLTKDIKVEDLDGLDLKKAGRYRMKYTVEDAAGNKAEKERIIIVDGAPVINIAGDLIVKKGDTIDYLKGVTVEDEEDKDLINSIVIGGQDVDNDTAGKYEVTYTVKDSAGNEVTVERVVIVDGAPVINIKGDLIIRKGSQFNLLDGVTVEDKEDTNLTVEVSGDTVDVNTLGEYTVTYTVKDSAGNVTTLNRIVKVVTNDSPIIIGGGDITLKPSEIENFDPIADLEINDDHDTLEDITIDVVITDVESGQIVDKISKPATGREKRFNLLISVTDTDGNTITLNRVVRVTNYEPVIEGLNDIVIKEGETVNLMAGVTVTDMEDGDITDKVIIPTVDLSKLPVGEHDIEYTVVDIDGNLITIKRKVVVEKANKSEIEIPDVEVDEVVEENVQRPVTEGNVDNPNTGDKGVLSYLLIAMASAIGLVKNRKGKKE